MAPALRSLDLDRPPASALAGPAGRAECRPHPGPVHLRVGGPGLGHAGSPPAPLALAAATRASERASMGSSGSRQPAGKQGLLGRRTQSSGSLCTAHADKLGRLLAPCGRHRQHGQHGPRHHCHNNYHNDAAHRHHRYKLCGSLPNHLDASRQDLDVCDNNNITPASPAVSEKDLQDLGYASERSPDDEKHFPGDMSGGACESVVLQRGSRGLGLSVCGGVDCAPDGLVRVKRLFPHQPAWQSGRLRPGDVLLAVNGEPLSGLTNHEALEVLRTASDHVVLTVARPSRPPSWAGPAGPGLGQPSPGPPGGTGRQGMQLDRLDPRLCRQDSCGELEVTLSKVQGSLGFTLRKEDSSALGHYVRALVREPALSDGRIRPGDKIVAVNGADISHLSHEEAVLFLRQAGDTVVLRLFRDLAQTPVTALSPTEAHKAFRPKALRKEALDMLSDLAVRRMAPGAGPGQGPGTGESSTLGRPRKVSDGRSGAGGPLTASQQHLHHRSRTQSFGEQPSHHHHHHHRSHELIASSQSGRGREESPLVELVDSTMSSSSLSSLSSSANSVVERPTGGASNASRARRPDFLHLGANGGSVGPSPATAPAWHLQKLTLAHSPGNDIWVDEGKSSDFASLPCGPASPDEDVDGGRGGAFSHRHPAYQSVNPTCRGHGGLEQGQARGGGLVDPRAGGADRLLQESSQDVRGGGLGRTGLLKWKGVVFTPEADDTDSMTSTPPDQDDTASQSTLEDSNGQVFTVELNRGWNSRLGFSLQSDGDYSVISAIYNDSVAAKNGKLKTGDRIIMVNDESVEGMPTPEVIDLFRKIRGPIAITVWREIQL